MLKELRTILIVDDSVLILERLVHILKKSVPNGNIIPAGTYAEAIGILENSPIDLALLDIHLQEQNGIDLLRVVKKRYPHVPVIILTNQSSKKVEEVCMSIGASYFLDKSRDFARIPELVPMLI